MGRIICKIHGETGIVLTCPHLNRDIQDGVEFKKVISVSHEEFDTFVLRYCPNCAAEYNFPMEDTALPDEKFESMGERDFPPSCYECFKELNN